MYYCAAERDHPQADGDEPGGDWATPNDIVHDVLVNKKSNAMLMLILFSSVVVSPKFFHLISQKSRDVPPVPVYIMC